MFRFARSAAVAATVALCAAPAFAADPLPSADAVFTVYSTVGDWTVYADSQRHSCLVEKLFDGGDYVLQMGATQDQTKAYLGVFTLADIKGFRRQKVLLDIDGQEFVTEALGTQSRKLKGDYTGSYVRVRTQALADALATGDTLTVIPLKSFTFDLPLDGLGAAMEEGGKCIAAQS
ncbi:MAG: hypothetical protein CML68_08140 [Rhodobacteraceae bacterium]|nr:hypothetical protein [Paracoccaceae bacterium]